MFKFTNCKTVCKPSGLCKLGLQNLNKHVVFILENLNKNYVFGLEKVFKFNKLFRFIKFRHYFTMRGGSLKKIAKKIIPNVPINKKV